MTYNELVDHILETSGLKSGKLTSVMSANDIARFIRKHVLTRFGRYYKTTLFIDNISFAEGSSIGRNRFKLPVWLVDMLEVFDVQVMGVRDIVNANVNDLQRARRSSNTTYGAFGMGAGSGYGENIGLMSGNSSAINVAMMESLQEDLLYGQLKAIIENNKFIRFTTPFEGSNASLSMTLVCSIPSNLAELDAGHYELFTDLATAMVRAKMYEDEFKYMENVDLGFSSMNLNLTIFSEAKQDVKDVIERMKNDFVLDDPGIVTTG